jgi:hypothetical protein
MQLYLQHFGRQCRLADYGLNRLKNLFEAIPATIEIKDGFNGERIIHLRDCDCKNGTVNAMIQAESAKIESNGAAPDDLDNQDDNDEEYLKASPLPLPDASNCKSILHQFGYNNKTARDLYKENIQYADGVWPGSGSPDHHSTATLEVSPPPTNSVGKRLTHYILHD